MAEFISNLSRRFGDRPAVGSLGQSLSFTDLDILSRRFASWVQHHTDLKPGDRIAIQLPNCAQYPVALFGALRAGLIVVNINPLLSPDELERQFNDAGVQALLVYEAFAWRAARALRRTPVSCVITTHIADLHPGWRRWAINSYMRMRRGSSPRYRIKGSLRLSRVLKAESGRVWLQPDITEAETALLQYTGGTTGPAKGVMLTHASLLANLEQIRSRLSEAGMDAPQVVMQPLPLYHIYSLTLVLAMLSQGSYIELIPDPQDLKQLSRAFERARPTLFAGVNPLFISLCQHAEFTQLDFSALKLTISGGMALTESAAKRWLEVTGCRITEGYGLTECSPVVSVATPGTEHVGTVGRPLPGTEVRIVGDSGELMPIGESGEIQVRGPQVMLGYWRQPQETARVLKDGWLATGDIGQIYGNGELRIIDRRKEVISISGFKVYPSELENVISAHPDILECAVIGLPDEEYGETIKVYVVANNPRLTMRGVREYCRQRLTSYKVPRSVEFCRDLPRSAIGKVQRRELREIALRELHEGQKEHRVS
ncbi:AMP-binding protein [Marinobacterium zhoushanense]|uniref:AMP-binding protein n=1 Tax=Marinobacterium zhoushanense TaxID=1679163 RepID=UPI00166DB3D5|nr:AMP-binding protein [Marinobacterium zhoushanense]